MPNSREALLPLARSGADIILAWFTDSPIIGGFFVNLDAAVNGSADSVARGAGMARRGAGTPEMSVAIAIIWAIDHCSLATIYRCPRLPLFSAAFKIASTTSLTRTSTSVKTVLVKAPTAFCG